MTSTGFETASEGGWPWGRSGRKSKKPRVVRGRERLTTRLSELAGLVLAEVTSSQTALVSQGQVDQALGALFIIRNVNTSN